MSVITVFRASFCRGEEVCRAAAAELGYRVLTDEEVVERAAADSGQSAARVRKAFTGTPGLSLSPGLARARLVAHLGRAVAERLDGDGILLDGRSGLLVPTRVTHVLRVGLVASTEHRREVAVGSGLPEKKADRQLHEDDLAAAEWAKHVTGRGPWDQRQYDLRLPMHELDVARAAGMIATNAGRRTVAVSRFSQAAWADFRLATDAAVTLTEAGHEVDVECEKGVLTALVNHSVLNLDRYAEKLASVLGERPGVTEVRAKAGPRYPAGTFYREEEFQLPTKVLLVDDESEFVMALSERLQMRDIGSSVALNGEEALSLVETEEPEVVVLDLRMPGVDGIEVLRRLQRDHPAVQVIILTGHGTEEDEALAMDLGAFAYLQKPVDIEQLTRTMEAAYEKIRRGQADEEPEGDG